MELKTKRPRVFSAKYPSTNQQKVRPFSGVSTQQYKKQDILQSAYNSQVRNMPRGVSAKTQQMPRFSVVYGDNQKFVQRQAFKQSKQKQQMAQEILVLKQTINRLSQELSLQRGKVETIKRKNSKYSKVLTMEFENQKQWGSHTVSNHLVTGIKAMYDNLKQKYEKKCKFCDDLIARVQITNFLEMHLYVQTLQRNNKDLKKKLEATIDSSLQFPASTEHQKQAKMYYVAELKFQNQSLAERVQELLRNIKDNNERNSDMHKKIAFLQKLMIQKDNSIYALNRKLKELANSRKRVEEQLNLINQRYKQMCQKYTYDIKQQELKLKQVQEQSKIQLDEAISRKQTVINSLELNNKHYQDTIIELRSNNLQLNVELQNLKEERIKQAIKKNDHPQIENNNNIDAIMKMNEKKLKGEQKSSEKQGPRQPQRANKKYNQDAKKKRKVQLEEIQQIAELIRFKMLAKKISLEELRNLFDKNDDRQYSDPEWSEKHISMEETLDIFTHEPINLGQESAFLLSRYIIEDVNEEHVYCDLLNQNYRDVVKSIIKSLIKSYPVHRGSKIDEDCKKAIENYGYNLQNALNSLYKEGTVPKNKFMAILKSLGIEIPEELKEFIVGKMALQSDDINELPFKVLF